MRGCLFVVVLAGVVLAAAAWFGAPSIAAFAVRSALESTGFASDDLEVDVTADPPLALLTGHADEVRVRGSDATIDRLSAGRADVTVRGVDLFARSFDSIAGTLLDVSVPTGGGRETPARSIGLDGPAARVVATVHIERTAAEMLFRDQLAGATGRPIAGIELAAPDQVTFRFGPVTASARLLVVDGGLVLEADVPGRPRATILKAGDPLVIRSVEIDDELVVRGTIDGSTWLGGTASP
jgi:hypothetical protein